MENVMGIVFAIAVIAFFAYLYYSDKKDIALYNEALIKLNFNPDYASDNRCIAIESKTKRVMLNNNGDYRVYDEDEISGWSKRIGYNGDHPKYCIDFRVTDLDNPNPQAWFGGSLTERDKWYARITTLFNG